MWFAAPWVLTLLVAPLLVRRFVPPHREERAAVRVPFADRLARLTGRSLGAGTIGPKPSRRRLAAQWLVYGLIVVAAARPQQVKAPLTKVVPMRDLMLAVDLSGSMETRDFLDGGGNRVDRLTAVKGVLRDFLGRRKDDRVGLVFFGSSPFLQAPFTDDHDACLTLLDEAQVRMCGPKTAFGDAIGLAIPAFDRSDSKDRVLIVLTDGNDTASQVPPAKAAEIARDHRVTVHCVGVGDPRAAGEEKFDEATLRDVARTTGGEYLHANDRRELEGIYRTLDALHPRDVETITHRPKRDVFYWPLAAALAVSMSAAVAPTVRALGSLGGGTNTRPAPTFVPFVVPMAIWPSSGGFHFLRPWWGLVLVPAGLILWQIFRQGDALRGWRRLIAPHLLEHLVVGESRRRSGPMIVLGLGWLLTIVALAGPTWRREPAPFAEDRSALVVVLECTPTMLARDVRPSRLARGVEKIHDLLEARPGARTALFAYAGSVHLAMPLTTDAGAIDYFAAALAPDLLPEEGDAAAEAVRRAGELLERSGTAGSVLLITDSVTPRESAKLSARRGGPPVHLLAVGAVSPQPLPPDSPPAPPLDEPALRTLAARLGGTLTTVTPDDADVRQLTARVRTDWRPVSAPGEGDRWQEAGYWLTPAILLLSLSGFRPGWRVLHE